MESPPTGPGRTLIMTRAGAIGIALGLICMSFPAGWILSKVASERSMAARIASIEAGHADEVRNLREHVFIPYFDHVGPDGLPVDQEVALRGFRTTSEDSVTWSHGGGLGGIERRIKVSGDGKVTVSDAAEIRQVATLTEARCSDFFRKVISSGLACYSDEAISLKMMLQEPGGAPIVTYGSATRVRIVVRELKVDREFDLYLSEVESKNYPDIIEYRSAVEIEKEIHSFVP